MRYLSGILTAATGLMLFCGCVSKEAAQEKKYPYIIAAEQFSTRFVLIDPNVDPASGKSIVWMWSPLWSSESNGAMLRGFANPSDAKIVKNGTHLLTASSGGTCALIELKTGKLVHSLWAGGNTHSADILPDGNIVTASSSGRYLRLFDVKRDPSGKKYTQYAQASAHGVVYDDKTKMVYSCGLDGIIAWRYDADKALLIKEKDYPAPHPHSRYFGGHDLAMDPRDGRLLVTGTEEIYRFDQFTGEYTLAAPVRDVKSVSTLADMPDVMLMLIPTESWWSDSIRIQDKDGLRTLLRMPYFRFYKVRWAENVVL